MICSPRISKRKGSRVTSIYITNETPPRAFESAGATESILTSEGLSKMSYSTIEQLTFVTPDWTKVVATRTQILTHPEFDKMRGLYV